MDRIDGWVDKDQQAKDTYQEINQEDNGSVEVYRHQGNAAAAGFSQEVAEPVYLRSIVARLDKARDTTAGNQPDVYRQSAEWLALTDDVDVRIADQWHWTDLAGQLRKMRVMKVEANEAGSTVGLDELRKP